jgi:predicted DNA-binding transcriptional regulator AlpA
MSYLSLKDLNIHNHRCNLVVMSQRLRKPTLKGLKNRVENAVIQALTKYADELLLKKIEPPKKGLVKIDEVISTLKVTKPTIYNWIKKGLIKPRKMSNRTLFDLDEIFLTLKYNQSKVRNTEKFSEHLKGSNF